MPHKHRALNAPTDGMKILLCRQRIARYFLEQITNVHCRLRRPGPKPRQRPNPPVTLPRLRSQLRISPERLAISPVFSVPSVVEPLPFPQFAITVFFRYRSRFGMTYNVPSFPEQCRLEYD